MDIILGMNWLLSVGVNINCLTKAITFPKPEKRVEGRFLTAGQVKALLGEEAWVFVMFASLKVESEMKVGDFPVVNEFPYVFLNDVADLPPKREVEFVIDLVLETSLISMAPYRMSELHLN